MKKLFVLLVILFTVNVFCSNIFTEKKIMETVNKVENSSGILVSKDTKNSKVAFCNFIAITKDTILANAHCIVNTVGHMIEVNNKKYDKLYIIKVNIKLDLAVLRVHNAKLDPVKFSKNYFKGQTIYVVTSLPKSPDLILKGNVSGFYGNSILINADFYQGMSGSPVVDSYGNVLGIYYGTHYIENIIPNHADNLIISSKTILKFLGEK